MEGAGIAVVPGATPTDQSDDGVAAAARRIGLPLLVKASAGGGGKGMRIVRAEDEVLEAIRSARREALAAFDDGTLYVERLIVRPRHVEVQIFGDGLGHVVHLFERECSMQRRHQKVIEETPASGLDDSLRGRMCEAAVRAAKAVDYRGAGTVEFLLEGDGPNAAFYFLEMNTRLQVEHPITEMTLGVDLVQAQIIVAAEGRLPWHQETLNRRGHAIECRIYAEDPFDRFLPQAGRILLYRPPLGPGIRFDAGIAEGAEVPVHYDPLLGKLIAHADSRDRAIARAIEGLRCARDPWYQDQRALSPERPRRPALCRRSGRYRTPRSARRGDGVASRPGPGGGGGGSLGPPPTAEGAGGNGCHGGTGPLGLPQQLALGMALPESLVAVVPDSRAEYSIAVESDGGVRVGTEGPFSVASLGPGTFQVTLGDRHWLVYAVQSGGDVWIGCEGGAHRLTFPAPTLPRRGTDRTDARLASPMPATVVRVHVSPGQSVAAGELLVTLEAMKMELPIRAPAPGVVRTVSCREGQLVQPDVALVELE